MSYRIYRTRALVLRSFPNREADKTLALFTEDFGLIYARAQGVRLEKSRLRYALADLSFSHISLVRGKAGWRVTGALAENLPPQGRAALLSQARIASLVSRMVGGEERNQYLFDTLQTAHEQLVLGGDPELIEVVSVSRILHCLGYIAPEQGDGTLFAGQLSQGVVESMRTQSKRLLARVNMALSAAQL